MAGVFWTFKICGKKYELGKTGIGDGCDKCKSVKRDRNGFAWEPGEMTKLVPYMDGDVIKSKPVKRPKGV